MVGGLDIKRCLFPLLCITLFVVGCVQRQDASSRDIVIDSAVGSAEQLPTITVEALQERINSAGKAPFVLDVRTPQEYDGPLGHIEGSRLIPVQELARRLSELSDVKDQPIFVICRGGGRSARATRLLLEAGLHAINVAGGMQVWNELVGKQSEPKGSPD